VPFYKSGDIHSASLTSQAKVRSVVLPSWCCDV